MKHNETPFSLVPKDEHEPLGGDIVSPDQDLIDGLAGDLELEEGTEGQNLERPPKKDLYTWDADNVDTAPRRADQ